VVHGTNDREVAVSQGEELARAIPGARLITLAGESHTLIIRSAKAQERVRQFIHEVEGQ
jgi:dipeptidyl aminopeptidase/acylaminoacyl peptidase